MYKVESTMNDFRKLEIWEKARQICLPVYKATDSFPKSEMYGLTSQIRRCSISISSNIAEGSSRKSIKEYSHFISIALGSAYELETQLLIAFELGFLEKEKFELILTELTTLQRKIYSFNTYLKKKIQ